LTYAGLRIDTNTRSGQAQVVLPDGRVLFEVVHGGVEAAQRAIEALEKQAHEEMAKEWW